MDTKRIFVILAAFILVLGACFSPWKGDEGSFSIQIGGKNGQTDGRAAAFDLDNTADLRHTIILSDGPGPNQTQSDVAYGKTVRFSAAPGKWTITITAFLDGQEYATGSAVVDIKPGPNGAISIKMEKVKPEPAVFTVTFMVDSDLLAELPSLPIQILPTIKTLNNVPSGSIIDKPTIDEWKEWISTWYFYTEWYNDTDWDEDTGWYDLIKWYTEEDKEWDFAADTVTGDITLYAKWIEEGEELPEPPIAVTGVSLDKPALTLTVGNTASLVVTISPGNAANQNVTWSSNAENVATVENGKVTAIAAGTATITVTTEDGGKTAACIVTVNPVDPGTIAVTGISLNKTTLTLIAGGAETLTRTIQPSNATNQNVTWSSNAENVATVNSNGVVTAVAAGTATITVTATDGSGKTAACTVTVNPATVAVTGVTLNNTSLNLTAGGTGTLIATVMPSNATNQNVTWSSGNTAIAAVSNGVVTAITAGTATITVTTEDGGKTAACIVTVNPVDPGTIAVTGISLNKTTLTLIEGGAETLTRTIQPSNATNQNVTWTSNNENAATVNSNGVVTAVAAGTATITVTATDGSGKTAACTVTVNPATVAVTGVTLDKTSLNMTVTSGAEILTATVMPSNATNQNVTWTSSDTGKVTVDGKGTVTAIAAGTATITVTTEDGNKTATCTVTVTTATVAVTGVTLDKTSLNMTVTSGAEILTASVTPSNATNQNVTWTSSDTGKVTVDGKGTVTAIAAGTATITVTTEDGNKTATCTVTVTTATVAVTGVSLNKTAALIAGDTETLTATVTPSDATNQNVTWTSSNTAIAAVNSNGVVTAIAAGTATITVTTVDGSYTDTCTVTVTPAMGTAGITITFDPITGIEPVTAGSIVLNSATDRQTRTLTVTGTYDSISWYINGITGKGTSFILNWGNSAYSTVGNHSLTVEVFKDGIPYSQIIEFTVGN